ncbi:MAG: hypothetical protein RLZ33_1576 [Bacteroidota bacterium]|jgi:hypothetical protein
MRAVFVSLGLFIGACSSNAELIAVNKRSILTDNNSKIWMVDQVIIGNRNFAPKLNTEKDVIIFYENGHCSYQSMRNLGDYPAKKGEYSMYSEDNTLLINFHSETWYFIYNQISEDTISLIPEKKSDLNYQLILVPFPEI